MANWYDVPSTITALKWGSGVWIPNRDFADYNSAILDDVVTGDDGELGYRTGFAGWSYTRANSSQTVLPYTAGGSGAEVQQGYYGPGAMELYANSTASDIDWDDHDTYAVCAYTGMLPFPFKNRYSGEFALAFAARAAASYGALSGYCKIALSQYSSSFSYLGTDEFTLSSESPTITWSTHKVTLSGSLSSSTAYVMLQIAMRAPSGSRTLAFDQLSLFTDPLDSTGGDHYRELSDVYYRGVPRTSWAANGVVDARMMDGHLDRRSADQAWLKQQIALEWYREDGANADELLKMYSVSKKGWGETVSEPCPVCIDPGFGFGPHWGYYHAMGSTFDNTFNPAHKDAGFDAGLLLQEI